MCKTDHTDNFFTLSKRFQLVGFKMARWVPLMSVQHAMSRHVRHKCLCQYLVWMMEECITPPPPFSTSHIHRFSSGCDCGGRSTGENVSRCPEPLSPSLSSRNQDIAFLVNHLDIFTLKLLDWVCCSRTIIQK